MCVCECMLHAMGDVVVVCWRRAVCWRQRLPRPAGSGQCMHVVCLFESVCVCVQKFDQSDKSTVVVYTLVLTRCADHILSACGTPPPHTFFSPCTHTHTHTDAYILGAPSPKPQQQTVFICDARYFLCFFSFTVPLVKALLKAG